MLYAPTIKQGSTWVRKIGYKPGGVLIDTAGYTAKMQIRQESGSPVLLELSTDNGRITLGLQTSGDYEYNIQLDLAADDTRDLVWPEGPTRCLYDIKLYSGALEIPALEGYIVWKPKITE